MTAPNDRNRIRAARVHPLADVALPVLLILQTAMTVTLLSVLMDAMAGRPFLPGVGGWALLFAAESFLFTGRFAVRELDMPLALRGVEVALMLMLAKVVTTAPHTGWNLQALTDIQRFESWAGVAVLAWAWHTGLRGATLCGALHPDLAPDPEAEQVQQNDHGEAFAALRTRLLSLTGAMAALAGILPAMAGHEGLSLPPAGRWIGPGLIALAVIAAVALFLGARLRQEITWRLERLTPPPGVLARWAPQALALILLPLILAAILPAGPRLPVERWPGGQRTAVHEEPIQIEELTPPPESNERPEWVERIFATTRELPPWVQRLLTAMLWTVGAILGLALLAAAWRQLAERLGWDEAKGLWPLVRALLRWYGALWQALWEALRGAATLATRATAEVAGAVLGQAGLLGRFLPAWGRPPAEPGAAVRHYFARLQADAARLGLGRPPGGTAAEFAARVAEAAPERAAEVAGLAGAYEQARYSAEGVGPEQVEPARRAWLLVTRALSRR